MTPPHGFCLAHLWHRWSVQSDVGGMKTLQRRWTTFLKAQLVCEDKPSGQRYNVLTDVFTTQHTPGDPSSTHFYGLFTSQWLVQ